VPIQPSALHPRWCDPRACSTARGSVDHRSTPMAWKSSTDDYWISTCLARMDGDRPSDVGTTTVRELRNLAALDADDASRTLGTDLTAQDARLLAAALVAVAEQLEAEQRREVAR
jgi:hypothetical protein